MKTKIIATILAFLMLLSACARTTPESKTESVSELSTVLDEPVSSASNESDTSDDEATSPYYFKDGVLVSEDVRIEITDYKVIAPGQTGNEYGQKPVIAFWYDTTNLTGNESVNAVSAWIAMFRAFQDTDPNFVNELNVGATPDMSLLDTQTATIKKDGTVSNAMAYELDSETVPVVLKATRGIDGESLGEQTFEIEGLMSAQEPVPEASPAPTTESTEKEFLPPVDGYEETPEIIFSTTGEENGLPDTPMYIDGAFKDAQSVNGQDVFILDTEYGDIALSKFPFITAVFPIADESVLRYYYLYQGWSTVLEMPVGVYVGWKGKYTFEGTDVMSVEDLFKLFGINQEEPESVAPSATPAPTPEPTYSPTQGERNALRQAKSYLDIMAFSRTGLIDQLEFEGYSHDEAVYGADNSGADWYEQASKKAAEYLEIMAFSRDGLIGQLEFDGFSHDEAVYGVEQNGY